MKEIRLTQGKIAIVDDEEYHWLNRFRWYAHKGTGNVWYAATNLSLPNHKKKWVEMHVLLLPAGNGHVCRDHINGDGLDNQKANLRWCSRSGNGINTPIQSNNTSGFRGVHKKGRKWAAMIRNNRKRIYLGSFETKELASLAYEEAADRLHGEYVRRRPKSQPWAS